MVLFQADQYNVKYLWLPSSYMQVAIRMIPQGFQYAHESSLVGRKSDWTGQINQITDDYNNHFFTFCVTRAYR